MTLAAFLLLLFFLPGFIFILAYYDFDSISFNISLTHKALVGLCITTLMHSIGFIILFFCFKEKINFNLMLILLSGIQGDKFSSLISSIGNNEILITAFYFIFLYFISFVIAALLRWSIKKFQLDRYPLFRIDNPWYYLFRGLNWEEGQPDGVKIAATIEMGRNSYLYVGILDNFFLNKEGNIDRLVLVSASRRDINSDKGVVHESERFYPIDGHYLILKYNEIKNLNIEYFDVTKKPEMTIQYVPPKE